jgi:HEAT repeat protein
MLEQEFKERPSRGFSLPGTGRVLTVAAALCGAWLLWGEFGKRGWIPGVARAVDDPVARIQTVEALVKRGVESVPEFVEALADADPRIRRSAVLGLGRIGPEAGEALPQVRAALADENASVRAEAATAFSRLNQDPQQTARTVAPLLADSSDNVRETVADLLERVGAEAARPIVEVLHSDLPVDRGRTLPLLRRVLESKSEIGNPQQARILLNDPDPGVRREAINALSRAAPASPALVDSVGKLLADPDPDVRFAALTALAGWDAASNDQIHELLRSEAGIPAALGAVGRRGLPAAELLPEVISILDQMRQLEVSVRRSGVGVTFELPPRFQMVLSALKSLKTEARPAVPPLIRSLAELHTINRITVMQTLVEIGAPAGDLLPYIVPILLEGAFDQPAIAPGWPSSNDRETMHRAGILLQRVSPEECRRQTALLIPRLQSGDGKFDLKALYALWGLGPAAADAVPALLSLVPHPEGAVYWHAVVTLGEIGPQAAPAVPALIAAIEAASHETDGETCSRIIEALGNIGPPANSAIPLLLRVVDTPEQFVLADSRSNVPWAPMFRKIAITSVGKIDGGSSEVLASLRSLTASGPDEIRATAVRALASIAERSPQALDELVVLLRSDNASVRGEAALAIGRLPLERTAAIEPLIENLGVENPFLRAAAAIALGQIGPPAEAALPLLRAMESESTSTLPLWRIRPPGWQEGMPSYVSLPGLQSLTLEQAAREAIVRIGRGSDPPLEFRL